MVRTSDSDNRYFNTMVFAVISGILSLMLLLLLLYASETVRKFSTLIITVEVGLIMIIGITMFQIISFENKRLIQQQNSTDNLLSVNTCPDYWTMLEDNKCLSRFPLHSSKTRNGSFVRYTIIGKSLPNDPSTANPVTIKLSDYNNLPVSQVCTQLISDDTLGNMPWTDVRAVCNSYRM